MKTLYRLFVVTALCYLLCRHPSFWGDVLWAAKAGAGFVSSVGLSEADGCFTGERDGVMEICIKGGR